MLAIASDDTEDPFENLNELADAVESYPDALTIIRKHSDIARTKRENKVGIIQGSSKLPFSRTSSSLSRPSASVIPQIVSLSPDTISINANSVVLTVNGSDFVHQSQILWNGNALQTTFVDSTHLQAAITQQMLEFFGGSDGSTVSISVISRESTSIGDVKTADFPEHYL